MSTNSKTADYKKLYLSTKDKKLSGLCGGMAEYFNVDSGIVRLAWIIFTVLTGIVPGIIAYMIAAIVLSPEPVAGGAKLAQE